MTTKVNLILLGILFCQVVQGQNIAYGRNSAVGKKVKVNDIEIYYEVYGEGHPLLLLHGNGGYSGSRANILPELIDKYQIILVDHRCHGQSGCGNALNYRLMASDINGLLDHLNVDSAYVYGHSDGGIIGLIMAFTYPDKVERLVVSGANIKRDSTALQPELVRIMKHYNKIEDPTMKKHIQLMSEHPDIDFNELKAISAPTLVISGDRDAVKLSHSIRIFQNIPHSNLSVLPGTTHFVGAEQPQKLVKLVNDFLLQPFRNPSTIDWAKEVARQILPGVKY